MSCFIFFFFNDTATTEIYTLSLHDALPIWLGHQHMNLRQDTIQPITKVHSAKHFCCLLLRNALSLISAFSQDRKSTRLNSSHANISYAVFCLKKKKQKK